MFKSRNVHTVRYGTETASFFAPRIWSRIPRSYEECSSVNEFKAKVKFCYPENCAWKLCKNYIYHLSTCHLLMLQLSARACSETAKRNSVCFKINLNLSFDRSSSLIETSQLICVANCLTAFFMMCEVRGLCLISGWGVFHFTHDFCRFLVELPVNLRRLCIFIIFILFTYWFVYLISIGIFSPGGVGEGVTFLYFARRNF